ncbi:hypothetical protein [Hoeflea alexandrii]
MSKNDDVRDFRFLFNGQNLSTFDRSLATISLRTDFNTPNNGYPINLNAYFSTQIVTLNAGDTVFDVVFEIYEAEVVITSKNTDLALGEDYRRQNELLSQPRKTQITGSVNDTKSIELGSGSPKIGASKTTERSEAVSFDELPRDYEHPRIELIKIGSRKNPKPLSGMVVRDYEGWFAYPQSTEEFSGVKAELQVREHWVRFRDPVSESNTKLGKLHRFLTSSDATEHKEKKRLFADLLKILALRDLQKDPVGPNATLDVCGIICMDSATRVASAGSDIDNINLLKADEEILIEFLQCREGGEKSFLRSVSTVNKQNLRNKAFVPVSSIGTARSAYLDIVKYFNEGDCPKRPELEKKYGANEIKDLISAGLILFKDNEANPIIPFPTRKISDSFKAHVCRIPTIQFARDLLLDEPDLSIREIGERLQAFLQRNWSKSSHSRNGHALRSWTIFAYGDILVSQKGDAVDRILVGVADSKRRRGQVAFMSGKNLERVSVLKSQGLSVSQIARELGISSQIIYNFRYKYPEKWEKL